MGHKNTKEAPHPNQFFSLQMQNKKELAGVGLVCVPSAKGLMVKEMLNDTAASQCGVIHRGDVLKQVDGIHVEHWSMSDVGGLILGEPGASVTLKFKRYVPKKKKYFVKLERNTKAHLEPRKEVTEENGHEVVRHVYLDAYSSPAAKVPLLDPPALPPSPEGRRGRGEGEGGDGATERESPAKDSPGAIPEDSVPSTPAGSDLAWHMTPLGGPISASASASSCSGVSSECSSSFSSPYSSFHQRTNSDEGMQGNGAAEGAEYVEVEEI
mmetsp:Transcript_66019/g.137539  ORF Transcript_66019/g.137539 Transcript_66019/m.137539 type:complete len:268 (+) Transcript_66019:229-1032(+)